MISKIIKTDSKVLAVISIELVILIIFLFGPKPLQKGELFFGQIPWLYNVNIAQFFFTQAAYPLFGQPAPFGHYQLSRTFFIKGNLERALEEANNELKLYPKNIRVYYILGLTYGYLNRELEAIEAFSTFIEAAPKSWAARNDKAWLQFRLGDIDGAISTIEPILSHSKDNPWIQNTYGTLMMNKKRYTEAKEAFSNAKRVADLYTPKEWAISYPGNDSRIYEVGLNAFRESINDNLKLLEEKTN